jgi:hypothetical protein
MAAVRWCREAVQLTRVVHYLSCFDVHRDSSNRQATPHAQDSVDAKEAQAVRAALRVKCTAPAGVGNPGGDAQPRNHRL